MRDEKCNQNVLLKFGLERWISSYEYLLLSPEVQHPVRQLTNLCNSGFKKNDALSWTLHACGAQTFTQICILPK